MIRPELRYRISTKPVSTPVSGSACTLATDQVPADSAALSSFAQSSGLKTLSRTRANLPLYSGNPTAGQSILWTVTGAASPGDAGDGGSGSRLSVEEVKGMYVGPDIGSLSGAALVKMRRSVSQEKTSLSGSLIGDGRTVRFVLGDVVVVL